MTQDNNAKAMALLRDIAQAAGEQQRNEAILDEVVITDTPGVIQFIGFASEPKPKAAPETARRVRWWPRWLQFLLKRSRRY